MKAFAGMDIDTYKSKVLELSAEVQTEIDKLPCSLATRQVLTINNKLSTIGLLRLAANTLTSAAIQANQITREEAQKYYMERAQKIPADYIPNANFAILNDLQATLSSNYSNIVIGCYQKSDDLAKTWGTDNGIFFDIVRVIPLYQSIKNFTPLTEEQINTINTFPSAYREMLTVANDELLAKIEANKKKTGFTVNEAGEVSDEDLFASIISKFSGKVLLVDFWATWCGPCRMANKEMIPMKEELKDKDIVYLYITGETSPLKTWENMIPDIHGEHYRVTAAQWNCKPPDPFPPTDTVRKSTQARCLLFSSVLRFFQNIPLIFRSFPAMSSHGSYPAPSALRGGLAACSLSNAPAFSDSRRNSENPLSSAGHIWNDIP